MRSRLLLALLPAMLCVLVLSGSATTAPWTPVATCSPGPAECFAWHNAPVNVSWNAPPPGYWVVAGCGAVTVTNDGVTPVACTWTNNNESPSNTFNVRKDSAPPGVSGKTERNPDNNGWYNRSVRVEFEGDDGASGVAGCTSTTYGGPDSGSADVSGTCTDNAGNTGRGSVTIKYDATAPTVEVKPERGPDANGWYNRAVTVTFAGADPMSGVDSCTPPVRYAGPESTGARLTGTCQDKAANKSAPAAFDLRFDTTPPSLARVKARISKNGIALGWVASKDSQSFSVTRSPGLRGSKPTTVYTGPARAFTDRRLKKGVTYRYTITAFDQAGNAAAKGLRAQAAESISKPTRTTPARTTPALVRPTAGARVSAPPLLRWTAVPKATYYNVQLYRDGRKILTLWPSATSLRLRSSWTYAGRGYRLTPGVYRWYVWPGLGPRSANRYGKLVGTRSFTVIRT